MSYIRADESIEIRNETLTDPLSIRSLFCGPFLVTFGLSQSGNLHTDVVLKLPVHSRIVAELEKDFQMNEKGGKDKRCDHGSVCFPIQRDKELPLTGLSSSAGLRPSASLCEAI